MIDVPVFTCPHNLVPFGELSARKATSVGAKSDRNVIVPGLLRCRIEAF